MIEGLAVSNIAWTAAEDLAVADLLRAKGIARLEVAPARLFEDPASATPDDADRVRDLWLDRGFRLVAMQALLFGRPDLRVFGDADARADFTAYISHIIRLAGRLGCRPLVFGSPKNRLRGDLSFEAAIQAAADLFRPLAELAAENGCVIAFEPNAAGYGCDFVRTVAEAARLAEAVDHPGFGVQLDAGVFAMERDDPADVVKAAPAIVHVHASAPFLGTLAGQADHVGPLVRLVEEAGYSGLLSVEMSKTGETGNAANVAAAVDAVMRQMGAAA